MPSAGVQCAWRTKLDPRWDDDDDDDDVGWNKEQIPSTFATLIYTYILVYVDMEKIYFNIF